MPNIVQNSQRDAITGVAAEQLSTAGAAHVALNSTIPAGATQRINSSGNVANASAIATLTPVAGQTIFVTGFTITGGGATAASLVSATLVGLLGGTLTFTIAVVAGATLGNTPLVVQFGQPLAGSAVDVAAVLTLPALGAGNTNASVTLVGYSK